MAPQPTHRPEPDDEGLDDLDPETVEDLDADDDADDVHGGTAGCMTF